MRILTIHNRYQQAGGEDTVFEAEGRLLREMGNDVEHLVFENCKIQSAIARMLTAFGLLYNPRSAARLKRKLLDFKPDVIHVHNFFPVASPSIFFVARRFRIPVVLTLHNYRLICPGATLFHGHKIYERSITSIFPLHAVFKGIYRNSRSQTAGTALCFAFHNIAGTWNKKVNHFIVLSEFARQKFRNSVLKADVNKFSVKPNFADDCGYAPGNRKRFFLYAGRLSEEKGIDTVLNAAAHFHFQLIIIGDGPVRGRVLECARNNTNIKYLGFLAKASLIPYLRSCTALIVPSLCYEGSPMAVLEAFAAGTPVIASGIGSLKELIEDRVNGLLFNPGDKEDLISKAIMLESDAALCERIGAHARETYLRKYTPAKNYNMLMEIYNKATEEMKTHGKWTIRRSEPLHAKHIPAEPLLPKLSIGIPTCNGGARIQRALDSIFLQKYDNLEIIISDNASTDNTHGVCADNTSIHPEITYFRQAKNIGLVPNFEFVRSRAKGKYFMWLSDDDVLAPGILHQCISYLEENPDFVLASGQIIYRAGMKIDYIERGFNFTSRVAILRLIQYYNKVVYGGMFHGIMRRDVAASVPACNAFGNDFHFVASLAYVGKIRNFDYPGYYKSLGGCSKNVHQCARAMGESALASRFPHFKIAVDAFAEVLYRSPVFSMPVPARFVVAVLCFVASFTAYYGRILPLTIGGVIKRRVFSLFNIKVSGSYFKQASFADRKMKVVKES